MTLPSTPLHGPLYRNDAQTATIAASPLRQGRSMAGNVTATKTATEERLYTIGEVSRLADLKPFVLRYWESEIPMLQPTKDDAGRRVYRLQDVDMVFRIKRLLYDEGYTIAGARRYLREKGGADDPAHRASNHSGDGGSQLLSRRMLLDLRDALHAFLTLLERR
jgi:DNA-binding transcriptional MerR regulator